MNEHEKLQKHPLIEYFEETDKMGIVSKLEKFGEGYVLKVGNIHIYFENKEMTYTGWGVAVNTQGDKG